MKNAITTTKQTCVNMTHNIASQATQIATMFNAATTDAAVDEAIAEANGLRSAAIDLAQKSKYLRKLLNAPIDAVTKARQLGAEVEEEGNLQSWTAEAAERLRLQGYEPIGIGKHKNKLAWMDADGNTHTLVFEWYDKKSRCVRMYLDHYTESVSVAKAKQINMPFSSSYDGHTSVRPHIPNRLEMTTQPAEMSKALVWALSGRVGESPYVWVKFGEINIHTDAADAAYKAAWPKK
jgi:hypothetical protein